MTTRLEGKDTQWLPFNLGHENGAGNPPAPDGNYRTAYLWEEALARDSLLDILAHYIHLRRPLAADGTTSAHGAKPRGHPSPTCAESTIGYRRINSLAKKLALHFWLGVEVRR